MNVPLWIVQILLAVAFAAAGLMKTTQPREKLAESMAWVQDFSGRTVKLIGAAELAAAVGLILPAATSVGTVLTPLAATGLLVLMALAARTHLRRNEVQMIAVNSVLGALALFVLWGRFGPYSR